ncbi:MAG TPA: hypothetical protein PK263_01115, partial [bacterium]|nr:hypothetical protein [bacterium]
DDIGGFEKEKEEIEDEKRGQQTTDKTMPSPVSSRSQSRDLVKEQARQAAAAKSPTPPNLPSGMGGALADKGASVFERMKQSSGPASQVKNTSGKVGRNDPCPCGATKSDGRPIKYKHCHGK